MKIRKSALDVAFGIGLDCIGDCLIRRRHGLDDASYRETLRQSAIELGRYVDDSRAPLEPASVEAAAVAHRASHPKMVCDVLDCGAVVVHVPESQRVQDLLENGTRLIEETRQARRERDEYVTESAVWRRRALALEASLRRVDPTCGEKQ